MIGHVAPQDRQTDAGAMSFIVFSDDWGEHPSSCQHLFRQIAGRFPVLWVNTIGMRQPKLAWSDVRKAWLKVSKMLRGARDGRRERVSDVPVHVCQPFMLPFSSIGGVRRFNRRSVLRAVREAAAALSLRHIVVVSTVPNACDYVSDLGADRVVYYCVDDFTQWPGLEHDLVRAMERQLIDRSDVLVATSTELHRKLAAGSDKSPHLLTHGVDIGLFSGEATSEHACLAHIPKPRAGYFGLFDERSDQALISAVAAANRHIAFVFTGPVATDVSVLQREPNIYFTGSVDYAELPVLVKGLDALFIPYLVNAFTASISPLKLKEYLVTGKPVIVTPMAEAVRLAEHISIASDASEWTKALNAALRADVPARRKTVVAALQGESWAEKARQFLAMCGAAPADVSAAQAAAHAVSTR